MKTVGYKAKEKDMTCRGYQFEVGKTYTIDNDKPLELCSDSGFHFCQNLEDVFKFYYYGTCRVFEVETDSDVVTDGVKSTTKTLTIKRELTQEDFVNYNFENEVYNIFLKPFTDEDLLKLKRNEDWCIRLDVVRKMENLDLMFETFKNDHHWIVRKTVVEKMKDSNLMFNTFKNDSLGLVREAVVNKMTDLDLMFRTFKSDEDEFVRRAVVHKMENLDLMTETFKDDLSPLVQEAIKNRMKNI